MPAAVVEALVTARINTFLADTPPALAVSLVPANTVAPPSSDDDAFMVVQYPVVNGSKPVINRRFVEEGGIRIVINVRRSIELEQALALSDDIAGLFRDLRLGNGLEVFTPSTPIINDMSDDANWFALAVIVPYRYQTADEL
jgi:hypothetical protein